MLEFILFREDIAELRFLRSSTISAGPSFWTDIATAFSTAEFGLALFEQSADPIPDFDGFSARSGLTWTSQHSPKRAVVPFQALRVIEMGHSGPGLGTDEARVDPPP
ncbi:hypothetical protein N7539_008244 [Penicillium diatomitis]|uniref:Uncharacterized protein n=1 Tax=Penicillium diatomitis TaxID=2819901 RepID=A0A9W9WTX0_9EURO|nr:uncharacterized protein N7539_008244 [Penicillium diatomitis]KAJ5475178.1 hypothetical protein N7539_008244 [Penicillium diatomitis]